MTAQRRTPRHALVALLAIAVAACSASDRSPTGTPDTAATPPASAGVASPSAVAAPTLAAAVDELRATTGAPGALGALLDGGLVTVAASGHADAARTTPLDPGARFRIASITKPIVSALVLASVDRGELDLDGPVDDLLPGVLPAEPAVTARHLLSHTSGIFDEINEGDPLADLDRIADPALRAEAAGLVARYRAGERIIVPDRVLVALAETHPRYFSPGGGYHYSNGNYQLAGMLLEAATATSLDALLRARVVEPLGLEQTSLAPPDTTSPAMRGYVPAPDGPPTDVTDELALFGNGGNGGIVSTGPELLEMLRAIVTGRLFDTALASEMALPVEGTYGLGIARYHLACGTFLGHGGNVNGTRSLALVAPDGARGIVLAVNLATTLDPPFLETAGALLCPAG